MLQDTGSAFVVGQFGWGNVLLEPGAGVLTGTRSWGATRASLSGIDTGECTYWAEEQFYNFTGKYPNLPGDAADWANNAGQWTVSAAPQVDSIVVFPRGVDNADAKQGCRVGHGCQWLEHHDIRNELERI